MDLNKEWHLANKMPNATTEQRLNWHIEHSKNCTCRPLTDKLKEEIARFNKNR